MGSRPHLFQGSWRRLTARNFESSRFLVVFLLAILLHVGRRWRSVRDVFKTPKKLLLLACTAIIVAANWLIFIWAVNADHMLDASLGYYINPLLNVLLGMLFLGERLRKLQWVAVFLASCGVLVQLLVFGSIPIVAIALALTFGFYGLVRKKINLEAVAGLFIETLVLLPVAAIYLGFIADTPTSQLSHNSWSLNLLLVSAGIVTTLPLLCFTGAATRLKFSTLGFFQLTLIKPIFLKLETNSQTPRCNGLIKIYS